MKNPVGRLASHPSPRRVRVDPFGRSTGFRIILLAAPSRLSGSGLMRLSSRPRLSAGPRYVTGRLQWRVRSRFSRDSRAPRGAARRGRPLTVPAHCGPADESCQVAGAIEFGRGRGSDPTHRHGPGAEIQRPLATVVTGGRLTSTLVTLVVLPLIFEILQTRWGRVSEDG